MGRSSDREPTNWSPRRWLLLSMSIGFGFFAASIWLTQPFATANNTWVLGSFGKLAIVLSATTLAWPSLVRIQQLPGGPTISIASAIVAVFFCVRPKSILYVLPLSIIATVVLLTLQWGSHRLSKK